MDKTAKYSNQLPNTGNHLRAYLEHFEEGNLSDFEVNRWISGIFTNRVDNSPIEEYLLNLGEKEQ